MKTVFKFVVIGLVLLVGSYFVLSSWLINPLDKSEEIQPPTSEKSSPEIYAFGYQPELEYTQERIACAQRSATKTAYFGDLHIHTALSADAFPDGTRTYPADAYRFAMGEEIEIPTPEGQAKRTAKLATPLDFAAVTDHAETFGEGYICRNEGEFSTYNSKACKKFRAGGEAGVRVFMSQNARIKPTRLPEVCGENSEFCKDADQRVWKQVIRAAEDADDKSADCRFTAFVGYEYTRSINANHIHRNAIFRNAEVPAIPASHFSHPTPWSLLDSYETECRQGIDNCDVLSIPHNSNISGGNAFNPNETSGFSEASQQANRELRNAFDRLMEITQHKGASECINGATDILGDVDELCNVEALRQFGEKTMALELNAVVPRFGRNDSPECTAEHFDPTHNLFKEFCLSSRDFARGALLEGMNQAILHGINPFEVGFIGSSDTHIATAGATVEDDWKGHIAYEATLEGRLGEADLGRFNRLVSNPGGLAGVYAVENSRDALFQSMKRREAFATSGTRIKPRFFAGRFADSLCEADDWLERAYKNGTPMGSKMPAMKFGFQLLLQASADPNSQPLSKLQLVKGWIDEGGQKHAKVIDVLNADSASSLCTVVEDSDYNPTHSTYYYLRAVERPSKRWSALQCEAQSGKSRPDECDNDQAETIYEMAWTSPIWFEAEK